VLGKRHRTISFSCDYIILFSKSWLIAAMKNLLSWGKYAKRNRN